MQRHHEMPSQFLASCDVGNFHHGRTGKIRLVAYYSLGVHEYNMSLPTYSVRDLRSKHVTCLLHIHDDSAMVSERAARTTPKDFPSVS